MEVPVGGSLADCTLARCQPKQSWAHSGGQVFYSPFLMEADVRGAAVPQSSGLPGPTQGSRRCPVRLGVTSDLFQCLDPVTQVAF